LHLFDDVISNRLFEIASVGACSICPDTPWIREHFKGSVFYYPAYGSVDAILSAVDAAMTFIRTRPNDAAAMARASKAIFEESFAGDRMLAHAVRYHQQRMAAGVAPGAPLPSNSIEAWVHSAPALADEAQETPHGREAALLQALRTAPINGGIARVSQACVRRIFDTLTPLADALWRVKLDAIAASMTEECGRARLPIERGELTRALDRRRGAIFQDLAAVGGDIRVTGRLPFAGNAYIVLDLQGGGEPFGVEVRSAAGEILAADTAPRFRPPLELWLRIPQAADAASVTFNPGSRVTRLRIAYLQADLGAHDDEMAGAQAALSAAAHHAVYNPAVARAASGTPRAVEGGGLAVATGAAPWSYVAVAPLGLGAEDRVLRVDLSGMEETTYVLLVDRDYQPLGDRCEVAPGEAATCWLPIRDPARTLGLVIQAGPAPQDGRLWLGQLTAFP
jgi:hypothetical protein